VASAIIICCDERGCKEELDTGMWHRGDAFHLFKMKGWRAKHDSISGYLHYCPVHAKAKGL
jgi:hypothetical protein